MMRRAPWILVLACAALVCRAGLGFSEDVSLTVEQTGPKSCRVEGVFTVDASSAAVWSVLTDYSRMPGFVSGMKQSRVVERAGDTLTLEQIAIGKFLFFSRHVRVLLKVKEHPDGEITFEDVSHKDFTSYRGSWRIQGEPPAVLVVYSLESTRKFGVPNFIARGIFRKNAEHLLVDLRNEIMRRAKKLEVH
ncbi:MAG TPA: SRPBCC family protein [Elusimicrobiota bacterium]|nr:SRPBCC family protein [Elusimicrobiota bacterium]